MMVEEIQKHSTRPINLDSREAVLRRVAKRRATLTSSVPPSQAAHFAAQDPDYEWRLIGKAKHFSSTPLEKLEKSLLSYHSDTYVMINRLLLVDFKQMEAPKVHNVGCSPKISYILANGTYRENTLFAESSALQVSD